MQPTHRDTRTSLVLVPIPSQGWDSVTPVFFWGNHVRGIFVFSLLSSTGLQTHTHISLQPSSGQCHQTPAVEEPRSSESSAKHQIRSLGSSPNKLSASQSSPRLGSSELFWEGKDGSTPPRVQERPGVQPAAERIWAANKVRGILGEGKMGSESNGKSGYPKVLETSLNKFLFLQWKYCW